MDCLGTYILYKEAESLYYGGAKPNFLDSKENIKYEKDLAETGDLLWSERENFISGLLIKHWEKRLTMSRRRTWFVTMLQVLNRFLYFDWLYWANWELRIFSLDGVLVLMVAVFYANPNLKLHITYVLSAPSQNLSGKIFWDMKWQRNILPWDLEWQWIQKTAKRRTSQGTLLKTCFATAVYDIWI